MTTAGAVRVRVPATSANVGPGYDCFGIALTRYDEVVASRIDGPLRIEVTGQGQATVPRTAEHLVYRSVMFGFRHLGEPEPTLELLCHNEIPHGGGQGSSAAAIVAGLAIARGLTPDGQQRMDDVALLDLASQIEGHPDNAAPAVVGGFTLAWMAADGHTTVIRRPVHPDVRLVLFSALRGESTERARALLPAAIPHADAAANTAAAALLMHALSDDPSYLLPATQDYLHQRYRAEIMPHTSELMAELRDAGIAAVVSGAGPSVLAFVPPSVDAIDTNVFARPGFDPVELDVDMTGLQVHPVG